MQDSTDAAACSSAVYSLKTLASAKLNSTHLCWGAQAFTHFQKTVSDARPRIESYPSQAKQPASTHACPLQIHMQRARRSHHRHNAAEVICSHAAEAMHNHTSRHTDMQRRATVAIAVYTHGLYTLYPKQHQTMIHHPRCIPTAKQRYTIQSLACISGAEVRLYTMRYISAPLTIYAWQAHHLRVATCVGIRVFCTYKWVPVYSTACNGVCVPSCKSEVFSGAMLAVPL